MSKSIIPQHFSLNLDSHTLFFVFRVYLHSTASWELRAGDKPEPKALCHGMFSSRSRACLAKGRTTSHAKNVQIYLSTFVNDLENEEASKIWIKQIISKNYTSSELLRITLCLIGRWSGHQLPWENLGLEPGLLDVLPCFRSLIYYLSSGQKSRRLVLGL